MKVFLKSSVGDNSPRIVAQYPDGARVRDDAHGEGVTVLTLPDNLIVPEFEQGLFRGMRLVDDWRKRAGPEMVEAEAKRRTEEVASASEQAAALNEKLDLILRHGINVSTWPEEAKDRKAEIDGVLSYVAAVRDRARTYASSVPIDLGADKIWPPRPVRKTA